MIKVRVDDFPNTKGEPQHTLAAFRDFHRCLSECIGGRRYLLGVIPKRCSVEDILFLRNETDCIIGMHGITHDEKMLDLYQNEFPPYLTDDDVGRMLLETANALDQGIGRPVQIYMPPRNRIDRRTIRLLHDCGFYAYTTGPETERELRRVTDGPFAIDSAPPHEYGRTDEMLQRGSDLLLRSDTEFDRVLTLHWTWEVNIGLHHMRTFFGNIPKELFADFDA